MQPKFKYWEDWADQINRSITRAQKHDSIIDASVLAIEGFSTGVQRRLISNLCEQTWAVGYVEVGAYCGGTACAAFNNKRGMTAVIYEDFSQSFGLGSVRDQLEQNMANTAMGEGTHARLVMENYLNHSVREDLGIEVDIYHYDGEHSRESQAEALPALLPQLAETFLFIVDDYNWESVWRGTNDSFRALRDKVHVHSSWALEGDKKQEDKVWHNGVGLHLCGRI